MTTIARTIVFLLISMLSFTWVIGKALDQPSEKERLYNEIDVSKMCFLVTIQLELYSVKLPLIRH